MEGAGIIEALGPALGAAPRGFAVGQRVSWAQHQGAYATHLAVPLAKLVAVPEGVDAQTACALMLQGFTAHYLVNDTWPLRSGESCLLHAGAGGVGLLLTQLAKAKGARVFSTVGSEAKVALAKEAGADEVIVTTSRDFEEAVREFSGGRGVDVVYESIGKDTFERSLRCVRPRGLLALFGQASGPVPPFDPQILATRGSLFFTRPTLGTYIAARAEMEKRASDLFAAVAQGKLRVRIGATFPLAKVADAHRALEGRATTGKVLLIP
jgi:NADPH2:quinone reductase